MFRYKLLLTNERSDARSIAFTLNFLSVCVLRESSLNMTRGGDEGIEGGGGLQKFLDARRGSSENLYTSKPTHDIIIQIGWFSTQQFNNLCNSAISRGLQI